MDYARFNYVAQPEDSISDKGLFPRINDYDEWAIEWGYKIFPGKTEEEEKKLIERLGKKQSRKSASEVYSFQWYRSACTGRRSR